MCVVTEIANLEQIFVQNIKFAKNGKGRMSMTENEALEELKTFPINCLDFKENQALQVAIKALSEIQQYRAIGTVEEIQKKINSLKYDCSRYEEQISIARGEKQVYTEDDLLLEKYRAIGTIEEFNALKDKSVAKKPIYSDFDENEAEEIIPYKAVCPICGHEFEFGTWNDEQNHHCDCGQKLDWQ